jgi:chorismate mutase
MKVKTYGQEVAQETEPVYKINPSLVAELYSDWVMPLKKEVQVA